MLRYLETEIVFREVPDETALAVNVTGCPVRCPDCHSKHLWKDVGKVLSKEALACLVCDNPGITCVALMGGDGDPAAVAELLMSLRSAFGYGLRTCWYSGRSLEEARFHVGPMALDYLKVGPYVSELGPLDSPSTNQRMYRILREPVYGGGLNVRYVDITSKFWKGNQ